MGHTALVFGWRFAAGRAVAFAAVTALAFTALVATVAGGPHLNSLGERTASGGSQLSRTAEAAISDTLGHDQAAFHVVGGRRGLVATNASQRLTARFGADDVLVRSGTATFGLHLLAYGGGGRLTAVRAAPPRANANRVVYTHGAITEWYANGPLGLEQGFDVKRAPAGSAGALTIALRLEGNSRVRAEADNGLLITGPGGRQLRYTGLTATDARGRTLQATLSLEPGRALIHVLTRGAVYPVRVDPFIQVAKFGETDPATTMQTGLGANGISVAGTTAAVSVSLNNTTPASGAVDIFVANSGRWEQGATRVAQLTDPNPLDNFAASLSLSADGHTLAVGASSAVSSGNARGVVFAFTEPPGGWASTTIASAASLSDGSASATDGQLGRAVSVSADGSRIAAGLPSYHPGNPDVGAVDVFDRTATTWAPTTTPSATATAGSPGDFLGQAVALSGNTLVAGAIHAANSTGAAYIFQRATATSWPLKSTLAGEQQNDFFGWATAISADAKTIVVTAVSNLQARGAAYVFTSASGTWPANATPAAKLTASNPSPGDQLGESVAIDGNAVIAGAFGTTFNNHPFTGAAFIFVQPAGGWHSEHEAQEVSASDGRGGDSLGQTVAISNGTAFVAAPFANAAGTNNQQGFIYAFGSFPTTSVSFAPAAPDGSNGWYVHPVQVFVSASDLVSPVTAIRCVLDPAAPPFGFGALPGCAFLPPTGGSVAANGRHVVYSAAINGAGYAGAAAGTAFYVDTVPPQLTCSPPPIFRLRGVGGLVTASVSDATSGPAAPLVAQQADVSRIGTKLAIITGRDIAGNSTTVSCRYSVFAPRLPTQIHYTFSAFATFTAFDSLTANKFPSGGTLTITCRGGGCPLKRRVIRVPSSRLVCKRHHKHCKRQPAPPFTDLNLAPLLANHHLQVNTRLTFVVTKPAFDGVIQIFTIRSNASPRVVGPTCVAPGSTKPGKNC